MQINKLEFLIFTCCILASFSIPAATDSSLDELLWVKNNAPPFYVTSGEERGNAFGDLIQSMIENQLSQYRHRTVQMPLPRLNKNWREKNSLCFSTMIHTDKPHPDYVLSIPNILYLPHGIIVRKDSGKIPARKNKAVSLAVFLHEKNPLMGKIVGRTYGKVIDSIIAQHIEHLTVSRRSSIEATKSMLEMLLKGRIDFIIDYKYLLDYYFYDEEIKNNLVFIPIEEVQNTVIKGAIACTNNDWGKSTINDINESIRQVRDTTQYKQIIKEHLLIPGREDFYWNAYRELLRY